LSFKKHIKAELTAPYRVNQVTKSWITRIPEEVDKKCLLFQGSPDIIIKVQNNKGVFNVGVEQWEGNNGDMSCSSQGSGRFQIGHQMKTKPYLPNSFLTSTML